VNNGRVGVDDESVDDVDDLDHENVDDLDDLGDDGAGDDVGPPAESGGDDGDPDDTIVLPWWQRPFNIAVIAVTAALLAGMIGWMIGDSGSGRDADPVDVGFLQDMRVHHEQAIDMSFSYLTRPDTDPRLRTVARQIIFDQGIEIGVMLRLLEEMDEPSVSDDGTAMSWMGHPVATSEMPGMATEEQLDELARATGSDADALFVELMSAHHQGGIDMAEEATAEGDNDDVVRLASSWAGNQQSEIVELQNLLANP
jgi:uncharacterized protein (DUF305 family)